MKKTQNNMLIVKFDDVTSEEYQADYRDKTIFEKLDKIIAHVHERYPLVEFFDSPYLEKDDTIVIGLSNVLTVSYLYVIDTGLSMKFFVESCFEDMPLTTDLMVWCRAGYSKEQAEYCIKCLVANGIVKHMVSGRSNPSCCLKKRARRK